VPPGAGEYRNRHDVLHHQHADGHPPVKGAQFLFLFQHLGGHHGAGKRHRQGNQRRRFHIQAQGPMQHRSDEQGDQYHVQQSAPPYLGTHQALPAQFQTDAEQQQ
jgi:hypothetical protein